MTANSNLITVKERAWVRGFTNLIRKENRSWWGTRRWWINALLWPVVLCGLLTNILFMPTIANLATAEDIARAGSLDAHILSMGISVFFEFGLTALAIGAVILALDLIIAEKQNGTAEWLLSKPIARQTYVLAKLGASCIPMALFMICLPAALGYVLLSIRAGAAFPAGNFLVATGIMGLHTLFYLCLTLMLGVLFNNRGAILGISLGSVLGGNLLASVIKPLLYITPWILPKYASLAASGQGFPPSLGASPILAAGLGAVGFVLVGLVFFDRSEY